MRRVFDDTHFEEIAEEMMQIIITCPPKEVSAYEMGTYRAQTNMIVDYIFDRISIPCKLGRYTNTTGIGNNWAKEIIYTGNENEEQICGELHLTDDMYGSIIAFITDLDNRNFGGKNNSWTIRGCDPRW